MEKKVIQISIRLLIVIILIVCFVLINDQISQNNKNSFIPVEDSNAYVYQLEDLKDDGNIITLKGWFFELKKVRNIEREIQDNQKLGIVIYDLSSSQDDVSGKRKGISLNVKKENRFDVDKYFKCEYDYSGCGFIAQINKEVIDLQHGDYQLIFKTDETGVYGIYSSIFIHNGEIMYVNPSGYYDLNLDGEDIKKIVEEGVCVASCPEKHVQVYQCGWKLFWIVDDKYDFCENDQTYIQFQIDTTQFDKLPAERIAIGAQTDNIGDLFEKYEITAEGSYGQYRVASRDIPSDYSITRIITGYYENNAWVWQRFIRPIYSFE